MKKFLNLIVALIVVSIVGVLYAAGTTNYHRETANFNNYLKGVSFTGTVTFADSAANYHTKPMFIGNCNYLDGRITTDFTTGYAAASDVIVKYKFSNDLINWVETADGDMDLDANEEQADTLGIADGSNDLNFHNSTWMIIEFDGQTANVVNSIITWTVNLAIEEVAHVSGQPLKLGWTANKASTNP